MTLPCICCGEADADLTVDLKTGTEFHCNNCDADFSRADVREVVARWSRALAWLASMPTDGPDESETTLRAG